MWFFICPACTINVDVSFLSFSCFFSLYIWCICTGIAYSFIYDSFIAIMRDVMPCFPGTTIARIIATLCLIIDICSILFCLSPKALYTSCILVGLQQPTETFFPPIHIPNALLKNSSCVPETGIDGPGPSSEYIGCPNIFDVLGLMNLSTTDPLFFPRDLSTLVANDVSKLSMIKVFGGGSFPTFYFLFPGRTNFGAGFIPGLVTIVVYWGFKSSYGIGDP